MPTASPTLIVHVSLTGSERDYDECVTFLQQDFRIVRMGTNGDIAAAEALVRKWAGQAAAIAVTGIREARAAGLYDGELEAIERVKRATTAVPVADGHALRDVLQEWAIRQVQAEMPGLFNNARTVVLGGLNHDRTTRILREFTPNLEFADPLLRLDLQARLDSNPILGVAANVGLWPIRRLPGEVQSLIKAPGHRVSNAMARKAARSCDVVVATYDELIGFGLQDLAGKTVVTSAISDDRLAEPVSYTHLRAHETVLDLVCRLL